MSRDPQQLFVISAISRLSIASTVQDSLSWINYEHPSHNYVSVDDDRLTDEICQKYADMIGEIDYVSDSCEFTSDQTNEALRYVLEAIGFVEYEEEPEPQKVHSDILLDTIEMYKAELQKANEIIARLTGSPDITR